MRIARRSFLAGAAALVAASAINVNTDKAAAEDFIVQGAQTLTVLIQYGPHWSGAPTALQQAVTAVQTWLQTNVYIPTTVCINVDYGYCNGQQLANGEAGLTQFGSTNDITSGYSTVRAALVANARSTVAQSVITNSFPSSDPTGGATAAVQYAHMRVLGLWGAWPASAPGGNADSYHGFGDSANQGINWFYGTPIAGFYDAYGTVFHEVTEGLFRQTTNYNSGGFFYPQNMVTYRSAGVIATGLQQGSPSYFSIDGGVTNLRNYSLSGDQMDWRTQTGDPDDSFNAAVNAGTSYPFSTPDMELIDAMGFASVP